MYSISTDGTLAMPASSGSSKQDFDFLIGGWTIKNRKLKAPLAGRDEWDEFDATQNCRQVLHGAGNFDIFFHRIRRQALRRFHPTLVRPANPPMDDLLG